MIDGELELVVELLGQVLRVDDRLVRADDRVDVLEEDDPGRDLVRPVDDLRLLLVLAEVAGGVEELLRHDRRAQLRLRQRDALAGLVRAAALEPLAHRRHVEHDDLLAVDPADPTLVEGDELHRALRRPSLLVSATTGSKPAIRRSTATRRDASQRARGDVARRKSSDSTEIRSGIGDDRSGIAFGSSNAVPDRRAASASSRSTAAERRSARERRGAAGLGVQRDAGRLVRADGIAMPGGRHAT